MQLDSMSTFWAKMLEAISLDNSEQVAALTQQGFPTEARHSSGITAVSYALYQGKFDAALTLLLAGANVNTADDEGWTPLHWAAYNGVLPTLRFILKYGGATNLANNQGETPLFWAVYKGHRLAVDALLAAGADPSVATHCGIDAFAVATLCENLDLGRVLNCRSACQYNCKDCQSLQLHTVH